jgi:hypothetical protein
MDMDMQLQLHPYRAPAPPPNEPAAFDAAEIQAALLRPHRMIELVLVERARLSKTVADRTHLATLSALMVSATVLMALPLGVLLGGVQMWKVAALLLGSLFICFPSLHVFSSYLGCRMSVLQNLVLALVLTAVAAMFALGFAPIVWFVGVSTATGSSTPGTVAAVLLCVSVALGMIHLSRCVMGDAALRPSGPYRALMLVWQSMFAFVAYHMADFLGLL